MAKQFQDLVLAKNASTENITIFELANFDGENDFIGNTIIDKSGFENNLTLQSNYSGALSLISDDSVSGIGKSFRIRDRIFGTNVVRHDALSASQNGKFTLSCWFKLENYPTNWTSIIHLSGGHMIQLNSDKKIYFGSVIPGWNLSQMECPIVSKNKWHHVIASYDQGLQRFWFDGNFIGKKESTPVIWNGYIYIGRSLKISYHYFDGWIDDVIYSPLVFDGNDLY